MYVKNNMHGYIMDKLMITITSLGNAGFIWIIICTLLIISKKYRKIGIIALCSLIIGAILGEGILKHIFQRARPFEHVQISTLLISEPSSYSFPSGHTTSSFAVSCVLAKYFKKYAFGIYGFAFLIAFSRLYLYVHYPTDVLAGVILGLISSRIAIYIFSRVSKQKTVSI
jgi:undecaprenyl-diphosphatase